MITFLPFSCQLFQRLCGRYCQNGADRGTLEVLGVAPHVGITSQARKYINEQKLAGLTPDAAHEYEYKGAYKYVLAITLTSGEYKCLLMIFMCHAVYWM